MNYFDWFFIAIIIAFSIKSIVNGFVKEILFVLNIIISILLAFVVSPYLASFLQSKGFNFSFVKTLAIVLSFIIFFLILTLLTKPIKMLITEQFDKSNLESIDKLSGFIFGIIQGLFICIIILIIYEIGIRKIKFEALNKLIESSFSYKFYATDIAKLPIIKNILKP
jgi:uncharacterized membrane protein required for colicin V production